MLWFPKIQMALASLHTHTYEYAPRFGSVCMFTFALTLTETILVTLASMVCSALVDVLGEDGHWSVGEEQPCPARGGGGWPPELEDDTATGSTHLPTKVKVRSACLDGLLLSYACEGRRKPLD